MIPVPVPVIDAMRDQLAPSGTVSVPYRTVALLAQAATADAEAAGGKYGGESSNKREGGESGTNGDGTKDKKDYDGKEGENDRPKPVGFGKLFFKYATGQEMLYMFLGTLFAVVSGLTTAYFILLFGEFLDELNGENIVDAVSSLAGFFADVGVIAFVAGFFMVALWNTAGEQTSLRIKKECVRGILKQDIGWFDEHPPGELPSTVTSAMAKIQDGIGRKVSDAIANSVTFVGTFIVAFTTLPKLAAVMLACFPFIALASFILVSLVSKASGKGAIFYAKAGGVANEVISSIRTIASLTAEENELKRYSTYLERAERSGVKAGLTQGIGAATMFASFFLSYALAFWYGTTLVADDIERECTSGCATGGEVITTIFSVLIGAKSLGQIAPGLTALGEARQAGYTVFKTIEREPFINVYSPEGAKPEKVEGRLEFKEVGFYYPSRPNDTVFESLSVEVAPGETLALCGPSGGGKSTIAKLLLRFYDPTSGSLLLDHHEVRSLNVAYYRSKLGYVGQEPVLFDGTIRDNIANGKPSATDEDIITAAKSANAHKFIKQFPDAYATDVGTGGLQLSGGQKQRIAIARALIKDPVILLLDEATSALDSESEKVVQRALDRLHKIHNFTTVVIAHRLSTIENADRIAVVANKGIVEVGTHSDLLARNGLYTSLCAMQGAEDQKKHFGIPSVLVPAPTATTTSTKVISGDVSINAERITQTSRQFRSDVMHKGGEGAGNGGKETIKKKSNGKQNEYPLPPSSRMWALNKPEAGYLALGVVGAVLAGSLFPVQATLIANMQSNLYGTNADKVRETGEIWSLSFVALAIVAVVGYTSMSYGFSVAGERLTRRLREITFKAILRHDVSWFDKDENSVGCLTTNLEEDSAKVKLATGISVGQTTQLTVTLLIGVLIGLITAWQVGLLAMALIPLVGAAAVVQRQMMNGRYETTEGLDGGAEAGLILGEALNGVTTVTAFNMQHSTAEKYGEAIAESIKTRKKQGFVSALAFGYSQGMMVWVFAVIMYVGAILVHDGSITFHDFFQSFFAVMLGAYGIGQIQVETGAATAARQAAARIFRLSDDSLFIDPLGEGGAKGEPKSSSIEFSGVKFTYPRRPNAQARRKGVPKMRMGAAGGRHLRPMFLTPHLPPLSSHLFV
ncbi:unnamed protein product [Ascophyllum nodosum]